MGLQFVPTIDLYGDVLEAVVARVPTVDLIPASRVSRDWRCAVRSSFRRYPRRSPWLILRHLRHPGSSVSSIHAFDPFSSSWVLSNGGSDGMKPERGITFLRGSTGDRLHTLSISKIVISEDPFGTMWRKEAKAPKVWRKDAVVAEVGRWIVVAGGGCPVVLDEGEVVGAVEVYDKHADTWESAQPMPAQFDGSASATWLSVAASDEKLYVMEKKTGLLGSFDPKSKRWGPTCQPRPDPTVQSWSIAIGRNDNNTHTLLVVGVGPVCQSGTKVMFFEVNPETMTAADGKAEEEMPREMVDRLFPIEEDEEDDDMWRSYSLEVCGTERGGYVYNPSEMKNGAVLYEFAEEKEKLVKRWEWVPLPERVGEIGMGRIELGCSPVGLEELISISDKLVI